MKARFLLCTLLVLTLACVSSAQLSGAYTIDPAGSGPTNFTTFAAATTALGAGVSGWVVFTVASTTFTEAVVINPVTGTSATNTVTFKAVGTPAVIDANAGQFGLTLNTTCSYLIFENLVVQNFTKYGLNIAGGYSTRATFCTFKKCKFDAPASSSSTVRAAHLYYPNDFTFEDCVFAGGGRAFYTQQINRCFMKRCEFDGKGMSSQIVSLWNSNDSNNLYENCFLHDCGASGYGFYVNYSQYGNMFWHNTVIVKTSAVGVFLGSCCAWSRANSFRNNIVINHGTGGCIRYGHRSGTLDYNDADHNCYYAPNGMVCELEGGSTFTKGTLAQWNTYFAANPSLIPAGGGTTWDQNSIEADPGLVSMTPAYDIHLKSTSPCHGAGTTTYIAGAWISYNPNYKVTDDFEGDARPPCLVDIGADEAPPIILLALTGTGQIGTTVNLILCAPNDGNLPYQLASAFSDTPPIPIDTRQIKLTYDGLLLLTVSNLAPSIFQNYVGILSNTGQAAAAINIPSINAIVGLPIHTAFVTIKIGEPSNIKSISNTVMFNIKP